MFHRFPVLMFWSIAAILLLAGQALAYIGPGAGMEFITYALGLLIMVGMAFLSILLWPFYTFLRWWRGNKTPAPSTSPMPEASQPENTAPSPESPPPTTSKAQ